MVETLTVIDKLDKYHQKQTNKLAARNYCFRLHTPELLVRL